MARATAEEWAKRVARWRDSGLTAKEFAAETGVNAGTLSSWAWRLRKETSSGAASTKDRPGSFRGRRPLGQPDAAPSFIELPSTGLVKSASMLELVVGDLRVRVPAGFDQETLGHVLRAVGACR
jgi:transposase